MSRRNWIFVLVGVGVVAAILIGVLGARGGSGSSSADAQQNLCSSLDSLESSTKALTGLSPQTASRSDYQSAVDQIQSDWGQVTSDASDVASATMSTLDGAWNTFTQAVQAVPSDASVSSAVQNVTTQAQALVATTQSTLTSLQCS